MPICLNINHYYQQAVQSNFIKKSTETTAAIAFYTFHTLKYAVIAPAALSSLTIATPVVIVSGSFYVIFATIRALAIRARVLADSSEQSANKIISVAQCIFVITTLILTTVAASPYMAANIGVDYIEDCGVRISQIAIDKLGIPVQLSISRRKLLSILNEWERNAPPGENREKARKRILGFYNNSSCNITSLVDRLTNKFMPLHTGRSLCLDGCHLTDLPNIFHYKPFSNIVTLDLSHNRLTDLPESIGNLQHLRSLTLLRNHFTNLPTNIYALPRHCTIYIRENRFSVEGVDRIIHDEQYRGGPRIADAADALGEARAVRSTGRPSSTNRVFPPTSEMRPGRNYIFSTPPTSESEREEVEERIARRNYIFTPPTSEMRSTNRPSLSYRAPWRGMESTNRTSSITESEMRSVNDLYRTLYSAVGREPQDLSNLEQSETLRSWLDRLKDVGDYQRDTTKTTLITNVINYLEKAHRNSDFYKDFTTIIDGASRSCGDRVALSILHLDIAYQLASIDSSDMQKLSEFLLRGCLAMDLLEECARQKIDSVRMINSLRTEGDEEIYIDDLEVYLGYPIKLKHDLKLPISQETMLFRHSLTPEDLATAKDFVMNHWNNPDARLTFLINNDKWKKALANYDQQKFDAIERQKKQELEDLPENAEPSDYTAIENRYDEALKELSREALKDNS